MSESGARKSTRLRKPITTIDQNLDDDVEEEDAFMPPKPKPRNSSQRRTSMKRPSTDDNDELELITPKKRTKKKNTTTATAKTSPYFNSKPVEKRAASPVPELKKTAKENVVKKPKAKPKPKPKSESESGSDSDSDDDEGAWQEVEAKPKEEMVIEKLMKEREEKEKLGKNGEVAVELTSEEIARAQGKRKKNINSKEHQLELQLKRVLKKNFLQKHKHHIVCNLAHGFHLVKTFINHAELRSLMLSLLDETRMKSLMYNPKSTNMNDLHRLVKYFNEVFVRIDKPTDSEKNGQPSIAMERLREAMSEHMVSASSPSRVILFAIYVRLLHYECRLVFAADLPAIRPKAQKEEKLHIPHGTVKKRKSKKTSETDETSQSATEDTSRLHSHDHSSDISRVVSSKSTQLVKDHRAISPLPPTAKPKFERRRLHPRYYWIELFIETSEDGYIPIDVYTSHVNCETEFENNVKFQMLYVWAFDTDVSTTYAKDVTKRYSQKWLTTEYRTAQIEHKTNGDPKWYDKLMKKYHPKDRKKSRHSAMENKQIESR